MEAQDRSRVSRRPYAVAGLILVSMAAGGALVYASVPHSFVTGETLTADNLNGNFMALDQRLALLEAKDPSAGTYPAVFGLGGPGGGGANYQGLTFCGSAPTQLVLGSGPATYPDFAGGLSNGFGQILFTNGGAIDIALGDSSATSCAGANVCAGPVTFFLKSPRAQTLALHVFLDNAGAIYVDGVRVTATPIDSATIVNINIPVGSFALSMVDCTIGGTTPTLVFTVFDQFLRDATYGLSVDYDRTFHRNGT